MKQQKFRMIELEIGGKIVGGFSNSELVMQTIREAFDVVKELPGKWIAKRKTKVGNVANVKGKAKRQ